MNFSKRKRLYSARVKIVDGVTYYEGVYVYDGKLRYTPRFLSEFEALRAAHACHEADKGFGETNA